LPPPPPPINTKRPDHQHHHRQDVYMHRLGCWCANSRDDRITDNLRCNVHVNCDDDQLRVQSASIPCHCGLHLQYLPPSLSLCRSATRGWQRRGGHQLADRTRDWHDIGIRVGTTRAMGCLMSRDNLDFQMLIQSYLFSVQKPSMICSIHTIVRSRGMGPGINTNLRCRSSSS
jgi:hypothetical protein